MTHDVRRPGRSIESTGAGRTPRGAVIGRARFVEKSRLGAHQHPQVAVVERLERRFTGAFVGSIEAFVAGRNQLADTFLPGRAGIIRVLNDRFVPTVRRQGFAVQLETSERHQKSTIAQLLVFHLRTVVSPPNHPRLLHRRLQARLLKPNIEVTRQPDFLYLFRGERLGFDKHPVDLILRRQNHLGGVEHTTVQYRRTVENFRWQVRQYLVHFPRRIRQGHRAFFRRVAIVKRKAAIGQSHQ